ncbi:MAG: flavin reductase family protein [Lachnospiraceae bacterium]|nr:flavin reductase family protein [Lachnospiraceae bacterium]
MHTFQPYPAELLELNPFQKIGKDWMLITAGTKEKANTMTASWGGLGIMWGKEVAYIFVRNSRYTKEFLDANDSFSLTFFEGQHPALKYLGSVSGRDENKIAGARFTVNYSGETPFIDEGNLVFICRKLSATLMTPDQFTDPKLTDTFYKDSDFHTMYIGEITQILAR